MSDFARVVEKYGAASVVSLTIGQEELNALTARQVDYIDALVRPLLRGDEERALDYGCGAGRFTTMVSQWVKGLCWGSDPCVELLRLAPQRGDTIYTSVDPDALPGQAFDVVFAWLVLGHPDITPRIEAGHLTRLLSPTGLLIIGEHFADHQPPGKWWKFRPRIYYETMLDDLGVNLEEIGQCAQLENMVHVLVGRRSGYQLARIPQQELKQPTLAQPPMVDGPATISQES